jgi:hypothetical protein
MRAGRRLTLILITTAVAVAALGATAAPSMARDFRVPTTTTLTASPSSIAPSGSATLTASVRPGLLVGPIGDVKFTDTTNGVLLGTIRPRLDCLLKRQPCVATITVPASALAAGHNTIVAAYSGGLFTKPSSDSTDVFVGTQNTCQSGSGQCTTSASSSDGSTSATIDTTSPGAGTETVQAFFDNETPPVSCQTVGAGDTLVYSVTNPGGTTKTVTLTLTGQPAIDEHTNTDPFSVGNVCFGSPTSFTTATDQPATLNPADGLFYGNLPDCDDNDNDDDFANGESHGHFIVTSPPCINFADASEDTWATFTPATESSPATYTESFTTTASDPKAHG